MFKPAHMQYSYLIGFYDNKKLIGSMWLNGCDDSIQAEQSGREMCDNRYFVKTLERDPS